MDRSTSLPAEVVCAGETMVAFVATGEPNRFAAVVAGAESNVAVALARLGHRVRFVSRVGDDPLGSMIVDAVGGAGVEVDVEVDPGRPTGILVRHRTGPSPVTSYHRRGTAASVLGPDDVARVGPTGWVHLTGITPALSPSAAAFAEAAADIGARFSFDVNHRPALWPSRELAAEQLARLARRADLVFVGDDEAEALFGTSEPREVASRLGSLDGREVVVKQGASGATAITDQGMTFVPALEVPVVDVTGAGDAFAAGYLAGTLRAWGPTARLRLAQWVASRVVGADQDQLPPQPAGDLASLTPEGLAARWQAD